MNVGVFPIYWDRIIVQMQRALSFSILTLL